MNNIKITLMKPGYQSKIANRAFLDKDEKTMK